MRIDKFISEPIFNGKAITYTTLDTHFYEHQKTQQDIDTHSIEFYGEEGLVFANEFLARMNEKFGTTYEYADYKCEIGKKHGSSAIHKSFEIKSSWGDEFEIYHSYDYDSVRNCGTNYGSYTKEVLIKFADAVDRYNKGLNEAKPTEFDPEYKMTDRYAEAEKVREEETNKIQNLINVASKALEESALDRDVVANAITAIKEGHHWDFVRISDKYADTKVNIHLDEMEKVIRLAMPQIKLYKDYFDFEVVNNKREHYYSSDDRWRTWAGIRYDEKNGGSYFAIEPYETKYGIRFKFDGEIRIKRFGEDDIRNDFKATALTYEEMLAVNTLYNDMWYNEKWGK